MAYTSGIGLSRMVYEKIEAGAETVLRELLPRGGRRIPGEVIAQAAKEGDAVAREVVETAGWYGGLGLSIIVQFLNPERIIVGGGLTHIGAMLEQPMMKALYEYTQPELWDSIDVRPWQLGDDIGILGAAAKVFADSEHHHDRLYAVVSRFIVERTEPAKNVHVYTPSTGLSSRERAELEKVEGVVFDVQRYSLHDGPGLRTNVFLKGCPLRCGWCSNPESQQLDPELALFSDRCIVCGQFPEACTVGWKLRRNGEWSDDLEREFTARAAVCPAGAMNRIGWRSTAGEILRDVLRDAPFYEDGGGLTLTGGEPTIQPHLAEALLRLTKDACISTAIETCGHTKWPVLEHLLPYLDDILYDLKHMDNEVHRAFTGVGNELILENLRKLVSCGVPVTVRVPLIPGFNDTIESLEAIAEFIVSLDRPVRRVDVLPYQTLGRSKYKALGREYPWKKHDRLTEEQVESLSKRMAYYGLDVNIGG